MKAPGNYLDQIWSNKISVLLCEEPKPNISMISGFLRPGEPLFIEFIIPNYFNIIRKTWKHVWLFLQIWESTQLKILETLCTELLESFVIWNFENSKIRTFENCDLGNVKIWKLETGELSIGNLQNENVEIGKLHYGYRKSAIWKFKLLGLSIYKLSSHLTT